jgi:hypothetical protein
MSMLDPNKQQEAIEMLQSNQGPGSSPEEASLPAEDAPLSPPSAAGPGAAPTSDQLSDQDLAQMTEGGDPDVARVIQALEDPNTPPEMRQRIETMLSIAARRRLAGVNGA